MIMVCDETYTLKELIEFCGKDPTFKGFEQIRTYPEGAVIRW